VQDEEKAMSKSLVKAVEAARMATTHACEALEDVEVGVDQVEAAVMNLHIAVGALNSAVALAGRHDRMKKELEASAGRHEGMETEPTR
jgi:hypothetical protein